MPPIRKYKCNVCPLEFYAVWGGFAYVEGYDGQRVILTHPLENQIIEKTLNIPHGILDSFWEEKPKWWWSKERKSNYQKQLDIFDTVKARRGLLSDCLCLDCNQVQKFDLKKDEKKCRICSSLNLKPVRELLNSTCPKCKEGLIVEIETGGIS